MAQLTELLNNIREGNYKDANATIFDSLYLKIEESIEDRKEMSEASHDKDGDEYQKFFKSALKKFGVTEPDKLEGDKKKEFYDYVDKNWKSDAEKETGQDDPKESVELDELGRGTLNRYREKAKKQISDIEKRGMKKGEKVSSKYKKRLKGRGQATTRLAKKAMEGAEMDIAKEKEKMASSQEKIRDLAIQMKKEKQRKRAEA
tara:strand:- start:3026 stop:3634 length:609 start_codon:yes stop_codon:yes gene_type:complete